MSTAPCTIFLCAGFYAPVFMYRDDPLHLGKDKEEGGPTSPSADDLGRAPRSQLQAAQLQDPQLQKKLGHSFTDAGLLELALTHSSLAFEAGEPGAAARIRHNEQLEFLGDSVLNLLSAEYLYRKLPEVREGQLTRLRAVLVGAPHLAKVAAQIELGQYLKLGIGEEKTGGRRKSAVLADALEAVLAAIYLDGGLEAARTFAQERIFGPFVEDLLREIEAGQTALGDYKSALQEFLQAKGLARAEYRTIAESGPDHRKQFSVELRLEDRILATAAASSKKEAQQQAARIAFDTLHADGLADTPSSPAGARIR